MERSFAVQTGMHGLSIQPTIVDALPPPPPKSEPPLATAKPDSQRASGSIPSREEARGGESAPAWTVGSAGISKASTDEQNKASINYEAVPTVLSPAQANAVAALAGAPPPLSADASLRIETSKANPEPEMAPTTPAVASEEQLQLKEMITAMREELKELRESRALAIVPVADPSTSSSPPANQHQAAQVTVAPSQIEGSSTSVRAFPLHA